MSFDIYVQWFDEGAEGLIPVSEVMNAFGEAVVESEPNWVRLAYGDDQESDLYLSTAEGSDELICGVTVNRPCTAPAFWDAVYGLLAIGNAVFFCPGSVLYVRFESCVKHVPADMIDALGGVELVSSAGALVRVLDAS